MNGMLLHFANFCSSICFQSEDLSIFCDITSACNNKKRHYVYNKSVNHSPVVADSLIKEIDDKASKLGIVI